MFRGIAPFVPFDGLEPTPVPDMADTDLERVLFCYTLEDPGLPEGYDAVLKTLPPRWASALGIPEEAIAEPSEMAIPNSVHEGEDYDGDNPTALRTRNSSVTQYDIHGPDLDKSVRILEIDHSGHFWPTPRATDALADVEVYGFVNKDIDGAEVVWEYLLSAD